MRGPTITVEKLRVLTQAMRTLDEIRIYWDKGETQRCRPTELVINFPGLDRPEDRVFYQEFEKTVIEYWDMLFSKTMRRLENEVAKAGATVGIIIRDPKEGI